MDVPKCILEKNIKIARKWKCFWGVNPKIRNTNIFIFWGPEVSKIWIFLDFQNVQIWKDNIFLRCSHNFSYIFMTILVINTGSTGPDLVKILEVPKISKCWTNYRPSLPVFITKMLQKIQEKIWKHLRKILSFHIWTFWKSKNFQNLGPPDPGFVSIIVFLILGIPPPTNLVSLSVFDTNLQWNIHESPLFFQNAKS